MSRQSKLRSIQRQLEGSLPSRWQARFPAFIRDYFRDVPDYELELRNAAYLAHLVLEHFRLARSWNSGYRKIQVLNPDLEGGDRLLCPTIIQLVTANRPFLIDTVRMELNRQGFSINLTIHPMLYVRRGNKRQLNSIESFSTDLDSSLLESFICMEVDREEDQDRIHELLSALERVLEDNRVAVADWKAMMSRLEDVIEELKNSSCPAPTTGIIHSTDFLQWLLEDNFILLGYRNYDLLKRNDSASLRTVTNSGLGILRSQQKKHRSRAFDLLPENIKKQARSSRPLTITKSNSRSTVHRPAHLDFIGIKRYNSRGRVTGEHRFLGLYTSTAYMSNPETIPLVRNKLEQVMHHASLHSHSHAGKALVNILQTYPRDELFQASTDQLKDTAMGILHLQERQQVRLFVRRDDFERFFACIVFIPRERFNSLVREKIQAILMETFNGTDIDFSVSIAESVYAQLYLIVHTRPGNVPRYKLSRVEEKVAMATRSWADLLEYALRKKYGSMQGTRQFTKLPFTFSAGYMEDHDADKALVDLEYIQRAFDTNQLELNLSQQKRQSDSCLVLKLFNPGSAVTLSAVVPILENMGLFIESMRPYETKSAESAFLWIHAFDLKYERRDLAEVVKLKDTFQEAFHEIWTGRLENDGFNQLVLCAGLNAREIMMLRAYAKYMRQIGTNFSEQYIQETLIGNASITRLLVDLFLERFTPGKGRTKTRGKTSHLRQLQRKIINSLNEVSSLDEDRILRRYFDLIAATLRTNFFQSDSSNVYHDYLSIKIASSKVPDMPLPRPGFEVFVYSPRVEGIHLRGGKVARGGIRWSDRKEDFRTEVLGLMKAQMVKNAVIVPVGAKGGFYVKNPPQTDRQALLQEGIDCYRTFIHGLLDITDNRIEEKPQHPKELVCYDDDDPYLVVAADKGTATFSDIANSLAEERNFWLGDAFASGGSHGYDHKKMGITARGAWESVKHNFQVIGVDIQNEDFTVVGIGDMAGDVFGNGMLLSNHIRLIGAFNHMHIFIDPDPDPAASLEERRRLFALPRSSWADYNPKLISRGGGVFPRSAKTIKLSDQMKHLFGVDAAEASPDELIRMLLMAPVDLLWNGGIGTYIKADDEQHSDVGDRTNDQLRINASQLQCRVIGEGGNLGLTQRARIAFSENGGFINADWIDNSGGVDCSDREVNIKILLNKLVHEGELSMAQRNRLLKSMTEQVADLVLQDNYRQVRAISIMEIESVLRPGWYVLLIDKLEATENFSRELENIPDQASIDKRRAIQQGFSRPETAVLLAYTKTALYNAIIASDLPDEPYLAGMLMRYFPEQIQKKYPEAILSHGLRREIVATVLTNSIVNRAGITFAHRLADETGVSMAVVGKAFLVARDIFEVHDLWQEIDRLDYRAPVSGQAELVFETQHLLRHATRWFIKHSDYLEDMEKTVHKFSSALTPLRKLLRKILDRDDRNLVNNRIRNYRNAGIPARVASRFAALRVDIISLELSHLSGERKMAMETVIKVFFALGARLQIHTLRNNAETLATENIWQDRARVDFIQELNQLQARLTSQALDHHTAGKDAGKVIDSWLSSNTVSHGQYRDVYEKMVFTETNELAMLTVVMNKLRNFL